MNILFILPEYYPHSGGGISTYYLHYIKALKPYCKKIKVIVGSGYVQRDEDHVLDGIEIEYLKVDIYNKYLAKFNKFDLLAEFKRNIASAWAMYHQANGGAGFDLIECTDFGLGFIPWLVNHERPVITRLHGSTGQIHLHETRQTDNISIDFVRQTELLMLPLCARLITHSKANQKFWNEIFDKESVINIDPVFHAGVEQPVSSVNREKYGLVTARIQEWKGPIQLCEALSKMNTDETPQIKWIGRDMVYDSEQSMAGFLKNKFPSVWGKSILPQKSLANEQIQTLQQKAKFGVIPSTWDMFNFTCLEFLGFGTPVICSDGAGCSNLIVSGKNGFKYPAMDTSALAERIRQLNQLGANEYDKMALAGLETINNQLSADRVIPLNLDEYKGAINNFKPKSSNPFLEAIYAPSDKEYPIKDILDTLPLKRLISYVSKRMKSKIGAGKS